MMNQELLYRFFAGEATPEEIQKIKEWTGASKENRLELYRERKIYDAMLVLPSITHGVKAFTLLHRPWHTLAREWMKIAAIVAVTVCVTLFTVNQQESSLLAVQTVRVPAGQRANVTLPDGTDVWLNAGTTLQYPVNFLKEKRDITLDGEAYFDVTHDREHPFIVHTAKMDVEVMGTRFYVDAYKKENNFETSLIEGQVKLSSQDASLPTVVLAPNEIGRLENGQIVVQKIDDYGIYRWKDGLYCFRDKPIAEIIEDLEKYYDVKISLNNPRIDSVELTGKFRISEGVDYILRVLQGSVPFNYRRDTEQNKIYIN